MSIKKSQSSLIREFESIHNTSYDYSLIEYVNNTTPVKIICKTHGVFEQQPKTHLRGSGCRECSYDVRGINCRNSSTYFINRSKLVHKDRYNYSLVNYVGNRVDVEIICNVHGIFKQQPSHHLNGSGCPKCAGNLVSHSEFINSVTNIHDGFYCYSATTYISSKIKITITCPIHGDFLQLPTHHSRGVGCPTCRESKGERLIRQFLIVNNILFIPQYRFNDCRDKKPLPFDFYLPDLNICIEYDGEQHHKPIIIFGGLTGLIDRQSKDSIKTNYCFTNGIKLIRINNGNLSKLKTLL